MYVKIFGESFYDLALRGMSYSYLDESVDVDEWWEGQREKAEKRIMILKNHNINRAHRKVVRQIKVAMDVKATRAFWSEMDTYQIEVTKQSSSTMHRLAKRRPILSDFSPTTPERMVEAFMAHWDEWKESGSTDIVALKDALPEGYLQRRLVTLNYEVLINIIIQRHDHRYHYWREFVKEIYAQVEHPELLPELDKYDYSK